MPQMAPMWWSSLFMMYILIYIMNMMIIYYIVNYTKMDKTPNKMKNKMYHWKW